MTAWEVWAEQLDMKRTAGSVTIPFACRVWYRNIRQIFVKAIRINTCPSGDVNFETDLLLNSISKHSRCGPIG
jgi:hypothetical protein